MVCVSVWVDLSVMGHLQPNSEYSFHVRLDPNTGRARAINGNALAFAPGGEGADLGVADIKVRDQAGLNPKNVAYDLFIQHLALEVADSLIDLDDDLAAITRQEA